MNNCKILNLPNKVLKYNFKPVLNGNDFWHVYQNIESVINDETLEFFQKLGIMPNMIIIFGSIYKIRNPHEILIHTDLYRKNNQWLKPVCGINYDLGPINSDIYWFDTSECSVIPIDDTQTKKYPNNLFYGMTYYKEKTDTHPKGAKLIEHVKFTSLSSPVLFRTDIAHGVSYETTVMPRFMISIRFDIDDISSWQQAIDIFSKYIKE